MGPLTRSGLTDWKPVGWHPEVVAGCAIYDHMSDWPICARQHEPVGYFRRSCAFGTGS